MSTTISEATSLDTTKLGEYVELSKKKRQLEDDLKAVKAELAEIEESLLDQFAIAGMSKASVNGVTVSLRRELWATCKGGDYERACEALRAAGLDEFVQPRFNANSLSAFVRELDRDGKPLPLEFDGAIDVAERFSLRATAR